MKFALELRHQSIPLDAASSVLAKFGGFSPPPIRSRVWKYDPWKQVAQLSQRDGATAAWVKFGQKWKRIFCRH